MHLANLVSLSFLGLALAAPHQAPHRLDHAEPSHDELVSNLTKRAAGPITSCTESGAVALTFDDGPYEYDDGLLDLLRKNGAKATWFVNGYNYDCIYDEPYASELKRIFQAGHMIGSHTWNHRDITQISTKELNAQLDYLETALRKILGIKPKWFRPPYGAYDDRSLAVLRKRGYNVVTWDFDSGDSDGKSPSYSVNQYSKFRYPRSQLTLNHVTERGTVKSVMPKVIPSLKSKGYKLVSVAECRGVSGSWYEKVGEPQKRDSSWTCQGTPSPGDA